MLGNEIITLVNQKQRSGTYSVNFDSQNLSNGIYFYTIVAKSLEGKSEDFIQTLKMILIK